MDYITAQNFITEKNKLGSVPGLDNIVELLKRMGNPQNACKCLHIAGTNGKGSIFAFTENILLEMGYTVGRYVSPTIECYLERFQINKHNMPEDTFAFYIEEIAGIIDQMEEEGLNSPTSFEIETAIAYKYFADENVDFALIECGMGGALDATNVIDKPIAAVFASISRDHMQFLGDTIEKISAEKAGIIKPECLCISYPQDSAAKNIIASRCEELKATYLEVDEKKIQDVTFNIEETSFSYDEKTYIIRMLGTHQIINATTAILLIEKLAEYKYIESVDLYGDVCRGLLATKWKGRMTILDRKPYIICDGAHNEKAWSMLADSLNKYFTNKPIIFIMGVLGDKEYDRMLDILMPLAKRVITITPNNPRALSATILCEKINDRGIDCEIADASATAIEKARSYAKEDDVIMICGSLSFLDEYLHMEQIKYKDYLYGKNR